jgi:hypothetical protein
MSLYQAILSKEVGSQAIPIPQVVPSITKVKSTKLPDKYIIVISRDLTPEEIQALKLHGQVDCLWNLSSATYDYLIVDIRIDSDRQWLNYNISVITDFVIVITSDNPDNARWLSALIENGCVTNVIKKIPLRMDGSFNKLLINSVYLPKRKAWCCC